MDKWRGRARGGFVSSPLSATSATVVVFNVILISVSFNCFFSVSPLLKSRVCVCVCVCERERERERERVICQIASVSCLSNSKFTPPPPCLLRLSTHPPHFALKDVIPLSYQTGKTVYRTNHQGLVYSKAVILLSSHCLRDTSMLSHGLKNNGSY